jgi:hypothetical protein
VSWQQLFHEGFDDPAGLLVDVETDERLVNDLRTGSATIRFRAKDFRGTSYQARARVLLPTAVMEDPTARVTVWFGCGYEVAEPAIRRQLQRGRIVVTSLDAPEGEVFPSQNPLARGPNTDYVLAHLIRSHSFVDPTKVVYGGGSAGGYAALMVAAEAFPALAAVPNAPVVNLGYQAAYFLYNAPRIAADPPADEPLMGVLMGMFADSIDKGWARGYGTDVTEPVWFAHSPVAHLDQITCPVSAFFSTGDFLVPIEQVSAELAAATLADLPPGVVMAAGELTTAPDATVRLVEALGDDAEVHVVPVPEGAARASIRDIDLTMQRPQTAVPVPASCERRWQVVVVDEGPTVFGIGHTRHVIEPDFEPFIATAATRGVQPDQLTPAKLRQLLQRWSGHEWLAAGYHHLDEPAAERADVERGLRSFCSVSAAHAGRFAELYDELEPSARVLPTDVVDQLKVRIGPE